MHTTLRVPTQKFLHHCCCDRATMIHAHVVHRQPPFIIACLHPERIGLNEGRHHMPCMLVVEPTDARKEVDREGPIRLFNGNLSEMRARGEQGSDSFQPRSLCPVCQTELEAGRSSRLI